MPDILDYCKGRKAETFASGAILIQEGDSGHKLFVLIEGQVEIMRKDTTELYEYDMRRSPTATRVPISGPISRSMSATWMRLSRAPPMCFASRSFSIAAAPFSWNAAA